MYIDVVINDFLVIPSKQRTPFHLYVLFFISHLPFCTFCSSYLIYRYFFFFQMFFSSSFCTFNDDDQVQLRIVPLHLSP